MAIKKWSNSMPRRKHESMGELISTFSFLGVGVVLLISSLSALEADEKIRGYGFLICSIMCILGGFRYPIARTYDKLKNKFNDGKKE